MARAATPPAESAGEDRLAERGRARGLRLDGLALVLMAQANLEPWVEGRGWAPAGRLWLVLTAKIWYSRNDIELVHDAPATFKLSTAQGPLPVHNLPDVIDVPADITVAQLAFDPHGTFTVSGATVTGWSATCETVQDALIFK